MPALRRLGCLAVAALFVLADADVSCAQSAPTEMFPSQAAARPAGVAAMLRLRIPFGDDAARRTQPTFSLVAATEWRGEMNGLQIGGTRYAPGFETGFTFGGAPVLKFGAADMLNSAPPRLNAAADDDDVPTWVWWGLGAVIAVTALAFLAAQDAADEFNFQ